MSSVSPMPEELNPEETPTPALPATEKKEFISAGAFKWCVRLLLGYFGLRLLFLALTLSSFVPPDEVTHAGLCRIFSEVLLLPQNTPDTYEYGLVTNTPWLYYWTMGKLLHLNVFDNVPNLIFLRILNIPLAFGTVFFVWRTLKLVTEDRLTQLLLLVALTNTPMFSFLSASVSYDNMTTMLAALSIYYLLAFFKTGSGNQLGASILAQLLGCLCKLSFLPLVPALAVLLLVKVWRDIPSVPGKLAGYLRASTPWARLLMVVGVAALALNLQLHGGNYLRYHTLAPTMAVVTGPEIASKNRIGAREYVFQLYTEGKISYLEALEKAGQINHPGDKADTFFMLMNYENLKKNPQLWLGPAAYARVWYQTVVDTIFGIKGHRGMFKTPELLIPIHLLLVLSLVGFAVRWRAKEWLTPSLAALALFYALFFLGKVNYPSYQYYGTPGPTLQGRYLFPVLGCFYVFGSYYLLRLFRPRLLQLGVAIAVALLFLCYDFPWFLAHADSQWLSWPL